jgi:hypothetical protein
LGIQLLQNYAISASIYINLPVVEKELKIVHLANLSGANWIAYWLGTFCFDFLSFALPFLFYILIAFIY